MKFAFGNSLISVFALACLFVNIVFSLYCICYSTGTSAEIIEVETLLPNSCLASEWYVLYSSNPENAFLMQNTCAECGDSFKGRSDKKFCSDACRNAYNNRENNYTNNTIKRINHVLRKNRKILAQLNPEGKASVPGKRLRDLGFDFDYFTHIYKTKKGTIYYFCYEQGYLAIDADFYTLVRREED